MRTLGFAVLTVLTMALTGMTRSAAASAAELPPVAAFFKHPKVHSPELSPDGRYLAVQVEAKDGHQHLAVIDLQTMAAPQVIAGFGDADVSRHSWLNEKRLIFRLANAQNEGRRVLTPGLWAVDRDGSNQRQLIHSSWNEGNAGTQIKDRRLELNWSFVGTLGLGSDSDEVLVVRLPFIENQDKEELQLARLNTRTGEKVNIGQGLPDSVKNWKINSRGELWTVSTNQKGRYQTYLREADGWRLWLDQAAYENVTTWPVWFEPGGPMLVQDQHAGYSALFRMDPVTLKRDERPLLSAPGFDVYANPDYDARARRLIGLHYEFDAPATAWFDPAMKAHQADIDAKLPGTVNQIYCGNCLSSPNLLVIARSDQKPPTYYLYRVADKQLQIVTAPRPELKPQNMGQRDYHRIPARDGLPIPVLVTQPAGGVGKRSHPTIVLVRGASNQRHTQWAWEPTAQFLASRGYLVLEPEFRGSAGYGEAHSRAGWKQWGLAMQDDLADTLQWAVKQGWADPQRTCIVGGGFYGGYAALMGAVRQGELFQCAVSWGGVTDITAMADMHWSSIPEDWKRYGMTRVIADPKTDADQIRATSPLQ